MQNFIEQNILKADLFFCKNFSIPKIANIICIESPQATPNTPISATKKPLVIDV